MIITCLLLCWSRVCTLDYTIKPEGVLRKLAQRDHNCLSNRAHRCSLKMWSGEFEGEHLKLVVVFLRPVLNHIFWRAQHPAGRGIPKYWSDSAHRWQLWEWTGFSTDTQTGLWLSSHKQTVILHVIVYLQFHRWIQFNFLLKPDISCWWFSRMQRGELRLGCVNAALFHQGQAITSRYSMSNQIFQIFLFCLRQKMLQNILHQQQKSDF